MNKKNTDRKFMMSTLGAVRLIALWMLALVLPGEVARIRMNGIHGPAGVREG